MKDKDNDDVQLVPIITDEFFGGLRKKESNVKVEWKTSFPYEIPIVTTNQD